MPTSDPAAALPPPPPRAGLAVLATAPNLVTLARIGLIAAAAIAWLAGAATVGLVLGAIAGATDYLDGYLARRLGQTTTFGAMLDQFADGFLVLVALATAQGPPVALSPAYLVLAMARELWVHGVRREAAALGVQIPSSLVGKVSSAFLGWGLIPLFAGGLAARPDLRLAGELAIAAGLALGLVAATGYTAAYLRAVLAGRRKRVECAACTPSSSSS